MPHLSNKKLDQKTLRELDTYILSIIRDAQSQSRVSIFRELLTRTEKIMLAKRIAVIFLLQKGLSPYKISSLLGISPSTAERFELLMRGGKFKYTAKWVRKNSTKGSFETFIQSLVALAFTGKTKSFNAFVREYLS